LCHRADFKIVRPSPAGRPGISRAHREPIRITRDGLVIDGYVRLELARQLGRTELLCLEYDLAEAESLKEMLNAHQALKGFNAFQRTVLALDLEPEFQEQARSHQQEGGRHKGSSKLTEAGRLDVRSRIAAVAGVSAGNVRKVKWLTMAAHQDLIAALKGGEISIHRAWLWTQSSQEKQRESPMNNVYSKVVLAGFRQPG
jgi:hypothetical protein